MRIGLLSDTHVPFPVAKLPREVTEAFRGVDLILHAGDIFNVAVLDELERVAPVLAASGDEELDETLHDRRVKYDYLLELEGIKLHLIHISLSYYIAVLRERLHETEPCEPDAPDVVVFGHDHRTIVQNLGGTLFINPGSPTYLSYHHGLGTVGILNINSGKADVQIFPLNGNLSQHQ